MAVGLELVRLWAEASHLRVQGRGQLLEITRVDQKRSHALDLFLCWLHVGQLFEVDWVDQKWSYTLELFLCWLHGWQLLQITRLDQKWSHALALFLCWILHGGLAVALSRLCPLLVLGCAFFFYEMRDEKEGQGISTCQRRLFDVEELPLVEAWKKPVLVRCEHSFVPGSLCNEYK